MPVFGVATKGVVFNPELKKYLVLKKSLAEDINPDTYEFPGGRLQFGEELEEAVKREIKEETGLDVLTQRMFNAWTFTKKDKGFQLTGIDFLCITNQEEIHLGEEHSRAEWLNVEEILNNKDYPGWLQQTISMAENFRLNLNL